MLFIKCSSPSIAGNVTPNQSAGAAKVPGPETGAVPKQLDTPSVPAPVHNNVPPSNNIYPNVFALPNHVPLQPVQAPLPPNPLPMHFPATSAPIQFPGQAFVHHHRSKYWITGWWVKGRVVFWISALCLCLLLVVGCWLQLFGNITSPCMYLTIYIKIIFHTNRLPVLHLD